MASCDAKNRFGPALWWNNTPVGMLKLYCFVCIYRVLNALFIQTQFDPDEYWQALEPAYCLAFASPDASGNAYECAYTWEWTRRLQSDAAQAQKVPSFLSVLEGALHGPVRSYLPVLPTYLFYAFIRWAGIDASVAVAKGPLIVNAIVVAAPTDVATVFIAGWMAQQYDASQSVQKDETRGVSSVALWALVSSLSSWFNSYALVRTYSNSIETALLTVGIALLGPDLFGPRHESISREGNLREKSVIRPLSAVAFVLGGMSVAIRFTAVAAWVPIGVVVCLRKASRLEGIRHLFLLCAFFGVVGVTIGCVVDRYFYGFWAVPFLGSFHFNVLLGNGSLYGTHPLYWYFAAALPAISGMMLPFYLFDGYQQFSPTVSNEQHEHNQSVRKTLHVLIVTYIIAHSFSAHKEFRFILPILPLVCVLSGHAMHAFILGELSCSPKAKGGISSKSGWKRVCFLVALHIVTNYPHLWFLGTVHQRAPIDVNKNIVTIIKHHFPSAGTVSEGTEMIPTYNIHYLMGCHSTPLYSHLHIHGVKMKAWTLDCSPSCRSDENVCCESDDFFSDPKSFISRSYGLTNGTCNSVEDEQCHAEDRAHRFRSIPDILVTLDSTSREVGEQLSDHGMMEIMRIPHAVKNVSLKPSSDEMLVESRGSEVAVFNLVYLRFHQFVVFVDTKRFYNFAP